MMHPNLLFLYTDEQRYDTLAAYGNDRIAMPNLNALAEQSCVCERSYVTQPVCTPSRSSLLTGLTPHTNGCTSNNIPLDSGIPCLPELLPSGRYATAHFGKWHLGDELFAQHGFQHWRATEDGYNRHFRPGRDRAAVSDYSRWLFDKGCRPANGRCFSRGEAAKLPEPLSKPAYLAAQAADFIRENQRQPFCLYVNFLEPHMPFTGPRDHQYPPDMVPLPDNFDAPPTARNHLAVRVRHEDYISGGKFGTHSDNPEEMRRLIARYWGLCSQVDTHCGTILDTLRACGLWDRTVIVFTSDHGDMMGSHQLIAKCVMYEEAIRVPLLIKFPGRAAPCRFSAPVSQLDVVPTLLELLDLTPPAGLEGRSRAHALATGTERLSEPAVIEWSADPEDRKTGALSERAPPERISSALRDPLRTILSGDGRWKFTLSPELGEHELYDLATDPQERENVFGREDLEAVTAGLVTGLRAWQQRTGDAVALPR